MKQMMICPTTKPCRDGCDHGHPHRRTNGCSAPVTVCEKCVEASEKNESRK